MIRFKHGEKEPPTAAATPAAIVQETAPPQTVSTEEINISPEASAISTEELKPASSDADLKEGSTIKVGRYIVERTSDTIMIRPEKADEVAGDTKEAVHMTTGEGRGRVMVIVMRSPDVEQPSESTMEPPMSQTTPIVGEEGT